MDSLVLLQVIGNAERVGLSFEKVTDCHRLIRPLVVDDVVSTKDTSDRGRERWSVCSFDDQTVCPAFPSIEGILGMISKIIPVIGQLDLEPGYGSSMPVDMALGFR